MAALRRLTPHLMFLLVVLGVVAVCGWIMYRLRVPVSPMDRKVAGAERISYYVVTHVAGPKFYLSGRERVVKLVSHAVLDGNEPYDPRRRVSYGLRIRVLYQGRILWQHDASLDTRQSKAVRFNDVWLRENAFTSRLNTEIADDRVLIVHLPEEIPAESLLEVTLLGDPKKALVRAYEQIERSEDERASLTLAMRDSRAEELIQRSTFAPWVLLSDEDKYQRLNFKFLRMPAVGEPGVDFETLSVFYTGFRLPLEELTGEEGMWLNRHRSAALNVVGPTTVKLDIYRPLLSDLHYRLQHGRAIPAGISGVPEWETEPADAGTVRVRSVSDSRTMPDWHVAVPPAGASSVHELDIPPGLHSLNIHTDAAVPVRIHASGPSTVQFGAIPYLEHPEGGRRLLPDERRFIVYETGPGRLPVIAGIPVPQDPRARILRVDVRLLVPEPPDPDDSTPLPPVAVTFEFLDHEGRPIATETHDAQASYTRFERIDRPVEGPPGVSDGVGIRVVAPPNTHEVHITTARDTALRLYRFLPGAELYEPPYREANLVRNRWRYAPRERRQWFPATPINASDLNENNQRSTLLAQVRLEPSESGGGSRGQSNAVAVAPRGRPERHHILEPVPFELAAETIRSWPGGSLARMDVGVPARFRSEGARRARIYYAVPEHQLGERVVVHVDDKPAAWFRITTTRGYWNLPRIEPGEREIEVVTDASAAEIYIDRPPVTLAAARLFRRRTVYALDATPLEIEVRKPPGKRIYVTLVVYAPRSLGGQTAEQAPDLPGSTSNPQIRAVIGGGVPLRVQAESFPKITVAERLLPLPEPRYPHTALFEGVAGQQAGVPRYITVPIGEDIVPGTHVVAFAGVGAPRMWARFFVTHQETSPQDRVLQWRFHASGAGSDEAGTGSDASGATEDQP